MNKLTLITLCLAALVAVGCQKTDVGQSDAKPPTQADIDAQIKKVDEDPNLPPQAKAMKKAMLQGNGTGQKSMSTPPVNPPAGQ